jgi:hypothetical protein
MSNSESSPERGLVGNGTHHNLYKYGEDRK